MICQQATQPEDGRSGTPAQARVLSLSSSLHYVAFLQSSDYSYGKAASQEFLCRMGLGNNSLVCREVHSWLETKLTYNHIKQEQEGGVSWEKGD